MNNEIKPKMVNGEPVCPDSDMTLDATIEMVEDLHDLHSDQCTTGTLFWVKYLRQQRDALKAELKLFIQFASTINRAGTILEPLPMPNILPPKKERDNE
jgi:hypothetical protein